MKKIHLYRYALIQLLSSNAFSLILLILFGYNAKNGSLSYVYAAIFFYVVIALSYVVERVVYKHRKNKGRVSVLIIFLSLALIVYFQKEYGAPIENEHSSPLELTGFVFLLAVWLLSLMHIFSYFKIKRRHNEQNIEEIAALKDKKAHTLPVGFYKSSHLIVFALIMILITLGSATLFYYLQYSIKWPFLLNIILLFIILFTAYYALIISHALFSHKPFFTYEKDLDFEKLIKALETYKSNHKLHPETRNFLFMIHANYMRSYNSLLADELWQQVGVPQSPNYRLLYDLMVVENLVLQLNLTEAKNYLNDAINNPVYKRKSTYQKRLTKQLKMINVLETGTESNEVYQLWPVNSKQNVVLISNLTYRSIYFKLRNDLEKAEESYKAITEVAPQFKALVLHLQNLIYNNNANIVD